MQHTNLLQVKELTYSRGGKLLFQQLAFALSNGQLLQIVGANGSGKTTLLRLLTGVLSLQQGQILWKQQPIQNIRASYLNSMLYLGHRLGVKSELTVSENLYFDTQMQKNSPQEIHDAIEKIGLTEYSHTLCRLLSQGQKQRVALAKLLLSHHRLWILDEPLTALDQSAVTTMQALLQHKIQRGDSVIMTSHRPLTLKNLPIRYLELASCPL